MPRTRAGKGKGTTEAVFDLAQHRQERYEVAIVGPDKRPTPIRITLAPTASKEYRARAFALARAGTVVPDAPGDDFAATEAFMLERAIAATVDWSGVVVDGETLACTVENARALYTSDGLGWLYEQVVGAHFGRERFFGTPASGS